MKLQSEVIPGGFTLSAEEAAFSSLLIHFGLADVAFCIVDTGSGQVRMVTNVPIAAREEGGMERLIGEQPVLLSHFEEVKVSFDTFQFTFIPLIHYNPAYLDDYAKFAHLQEGSVAGMNRITTAGIANVYAIDTGFQTALNVHFRHPKIFTQVSAFLNGARRISQASANDNVFIGVKPTVFEIAIIKEDGLQYYNLFKYSNPEEFNYFLVTVLQNFRLSGQSSFLTIFGAIDEGDVLFMILRKYFERIIFANADVIFALSPALRNLHASRYYSLLSLQLCD